MNSAYFKQHASAGFSGARDAAFALLRWEGEGGSPSLSPELDLMSRPLIGTPAQIEWAESIRACVNDEFDRVAASFRSIAQRQGAGKRTDTKAIIAILEDKRVEVLSREKAGYFISNWQEISDQVRKMIANDCRFQAIRLRKPTVTVSVETEL